MNKPDTAKIAEAISRPGIDPRRHVDLGIVTAVAVDEDGIHADVIMMDGVDETISHTSPYAGPGYGIHFPLDLDEAITVATPDGRPNAGGRSVGRSWDRGTPPPKDVIDHPDDVVLVVKEDQSLRMITTGDGKVLIDCRDGQDVIIQAVDLGVVDPETGDRSGIVRLGAEPTGVTSQLPILTTDDGAVFMQALDVAILALASNPTAAAAIQALKDALTALQWPMGALNVVATPRDPIA